MRQGLPAIWRAWCRLVHVHHDRDWQALGSYGYAECRCGARRTSRRFWKMGVRAAPGWPASVDRHGRFAACSGWHPRPAAGWPTPKSDLRARSVPGQPPSDPSGISPSPGTGAR